MKLSMKLENLKKLQKMNHRTKALQTSYWRLIEVFNLQSSTYRLSKDSALFRMMPKRRKKLRKCQWKKDAIQKYNFFRRNIKINKHWFKLISNRKMLMSLRILNIWKNHSWKLIILSNLWQSTIRIIILNKIKKKMLLKWVISTL